MKRILRFSSLGFGSLCVLCFVAYSILSAAGVDQEPLARFEMSEWSTEAGLIEDYSNPGTEQPWVATVKDVLVHIENMETRLEVYSAELEAIEKEDEAVRMAEALELDEQNPARALEILMNRFKEASEIYGTFSDDQKVVFSDLDGTDQISALDEAAATNGEFNAFCDRLAEKRAAFLASEARREEVAFDMVIGSVHSVIDGATEASILHTAGLQAEKACHAASACAKAVTTPADTSAPASGGPAKDDPSPPEKTGK